MMDQDMRHTYIWKDQPEEDRELNNSRRINVPDLPRIYEKHIGDIKSANSLGANMVKQTTEQWSKIPDLGLVDNITDHQFDTSPLFQLLTTINPKQSRYWLQKFETFDKTRFNWSWNWSSFFLGPIYYLEKGMYQKAIQYTLGFFLLYYTLYSFVLNEMDARKLVWLGGMCFFGIVGSNDYLKFCLINRDNLNKMKIIKRRGIALTLGLFILDIAYRFYLK